MESLIFILILVIIGAFLGFIESLPGSFPFDDLEETKHPNQKSVQRIHKIVTSGDSTESGLIILEILFYLAGAFLGTSIIFQATNYYPFAVLFIIAYIGTILLFRTFFVFLAIRFNLKLSLAIAPIIYFFWSFGKPFNYFVRKVHIFANPVKEEASRYELNALVESAHEEGSIDQEEYRILKNVMNFNEVLVSDVMTPRTVIFSCEADMTVAEMINLPELRMYSRIPLWEGKSIEDGVVGYATSKDILYAALTGKGNEKLRKFSREIFFIPENAELDVALERFLKRRQHIFLVVDEYGGIDGLITMEDVMETILGVEIVDEADREVDLREFAKLRRDKRVAQLTEKSK